MCKCYILGRQIAFTVILKRREETVMCIVWVISNCFSQLLLCNKLPLPALQMASDYLRVSVSHESGCVRVSQGCKPVICQNYRSPLARTRHELLVNSSVCCRLWIIRSKLTCRAVVSLHILPSSGCVALFPYFWCLSTEEVILAVGFPKKKQWSKEDNRGGRTLSLLLSLNLRSKFLLHFPQFCSLEPG